MPFVKIKGLTGKVYVPEKSLSIITKHPCPDCFSCGACSNERCRLCRQAQPPACKKTK